MPGPAGPYLALASVSVTPEYQNPGSIVSTPEATHVPIPGSTRTAQRGAFRVNDADALAQVEATLILRRTDEEQAAHEDDVAAVLDFAADHGLDIVAVHAEARAVSVSGSVAAMNAAFRVDLGTYAYQGQIFRGREGDIHIPTALDGVVIAVLGLDERAQARTPYRSSPRAQGGYTAPQVASRYNFPTTGNGAGQTIGLIELGGGYHASDLANYFKQLGITAPKVTSVGVGGASNSPGSSADVEVALDIEVAGAVAPGANIAVYFGPNTDAGFYQAIATAINDKTNKPSVISISWGGPESSWTAQALTAFDALFADAATLGITVLAAAGDNGSSDGTNAPTVDFPASSPHVVACGGTTLTSANETVWNENAANEGATGGGVSQFFSKPTYQDGVTVPAAPNGAIGRGVPDVAGNADPLTGYWVLVNGQSGYVGGTSAVAPLWAGLIAIANQINGANAGMPHTALYATPSALNDIVSGNNGAYQAGVGFDLCTGLGSPKGQAVVAALAPVVAPPPPPPVPTPTPVPVPTPTGPPADVPVLVALLTAFDSFAQSQEASFTQLQKAVDVALAALKAES